MSETDEGSTFLQRTTLPFSVFAMHFWGLLLEYWCSVCGLLLHLVDVIVVGGLILMELLESIPLNRDKIDADVNLIVWLSCGKSLDQKI